MKNVNLRKNNTRHFKENYSSKVSFGYGIHLVFCLKEHGKKFNFAQKQKRSDARKTTVKNVFLRENNTMYFQKKLQ